MKITSKKSIRGGLTSRLQFRNVTNGSKIPMYTYNSYLVYTYDSYLVICVAQSRLGVQF